MYLVVNKVMKLFAISRSGEGGRGPQIDIYPATFRCPISSFLPYLTLPSSPDIVQVYACDRLIYHHHGARILLQELQGVFAHFGGIHGLIALR
jgi:hypothetical protein